MNDGRRKLLALLQRVPGKVVAAKVGVSASKVSEWASGTRPPSARGKKALAFTFGIPEDSWGEPRAVHRSRTW